MRKTAALPALALLLLTGCSAADAEPAVSASSSAPTTAAAPSAAAAVVPSPVADEDPEQATCVQLLGADGGGPLYKSVSMVRISGGTYQVAPSTPETTRQLRDTVLGLAEGAPEDLAPLLKELSAVTSANGRAMSFDPYAWSGAVTELLTRCAPYEPAGTSAPVAADLATPDAVGARFPGYPLVVEASSVDYRVAAWIGGKLIGGRVVALAPGLYAPYDPSVPDLSAYYVSAGVSGDTAMKQTLFPGSGTAGAWSGVASGVQEP